MSNKKPFHSPPQGLNCLCQWFWVHHMEEVQEDLHKLYGQWVEEYGIIQSIQPAGCYLLKQLNYMMVYLFCLPFYFQQ